MPDRVFSIKPSISYIVILTLFIIGSLAVVLSLPLGLSAKLGLFIAVAVYGAQLIWREGLLKSRFAVTAIEQRPDGVWVLEIRAQRHEAVLRGDSTVTHLASVLRFHIPGQRFPLSCTLFRDSLAPDAYRQLTVAIRHR